MPDAAPPVRIRRAALPDAPALAVFAAKTFADAFGADNRPEDLRAHLEATYGPQQQAREITSPDEITLLAFREDALVGFAQVRRNTPPACVTHPNPVELHRFYVDRAAHGQGVAQSLMFEAKGAGRELGGEHLWLSVWQHNPRAIAFYAKAHFRVVGEADFFVGPDRQTDHIMVAPVD